METKFLDFVEVKPEKVNNILILLHGYGSNNKDFLNLGLQLRDLLPNTAIISVNGPWKSEVGDGYQWFSLKTMNLFSILKEIKLSNNLLNKFIDQQLKRFNLEDGNLIIGGFSQGAMLSLYTGLRRENSPFAILSFSGMVPDTMESLKKDLKSKPNVLLIHGTADKTVPYNSLEKAEYLLREFDVPFEAYSIQDMGHTINDEALEDAREYIKMICNKI